MEFEGERYRYVHSLQGDIIAIVDSAGNRVVEYKYDVWGKISDDSEYAGIGKLNIFRYRGYAWDDESKQYYLRSRYYNSEISRFISPDIIAAKTSDMISSVRNLYTYCYNEANNHADDDGTLGFFATMLLGGMVSAISNAITQLLFNDEGERFSWGDMLFSFGTGMISAFGGMMGKSVSVIVSAAVEGLTYYCETDNDSENFEDCALRMFYAGLSASLAPQYETNYVDELMGVESKLTAQVDTTYSMMSSILGSYYMDRSQSRGKKKGNNRSTWTQGRDFYYATRFDPVLGKVRNDIVVFVWRERINADVFLRWLLPWKETV